jgi:hypothetical protein
MANAPPARDGPTSPASFDAAIGPSGAVGASGARGPCRRSRRRRSRSRCGRTGCPVRRRPRRHRRGRRAVDRGGEVLLLLRLVDGGVGGGVDHRLGRMGPDRRGAGRGVGQIGLVAAERDDVGLPRELRGDLPGLAENQDAHRPYPPSRGVRRRPRRACSARHQSSFSRYQSTVRASPSSTVTEGCQPSSSRMRVASMA